MSEMQFNKISTYIILTVMVFIVGILSWQYFNGGVLSHHLLHNPDLPAISNWWGILILPFLAWFTTSRIKKRTAFQSDDLIVTKRILNGILIGFFGVLLIAVIQSIAFEFGYENITMYLALFMLLIAVFLPIYRAECILGYVLGAVFTFGAVIPLIGMLVFAMISVLSNLCIKPLLAKLWRYLKRIKSPQDSNSV